MKMKMKKDENDYYYPVYVFEDEINEYLYGVLITIALFGISIFIGIIVGFIRQVIS